MLGRLSFIGRRPINFIKSDVKVDIQPFKYHISNVKFGKIPFASTIQVSGKLGTYGVNLIDGLTCELSEGLAPEESKITIGIDTSKFDKFNKYQQKFLKSMHGTTNSILMKYVEGVSEGHQVSIQLVGVGYKAAIEGQALNFRLGFSHPIIMEIPDGIKVRLVSPTKIILTGPDYQQITQFAAKIRSKRPPEPYNGKGVFVDNEQIIRKEGKKSK